MKKIIQTTIIALAIVAISGCYLALDNGSGEVGIVLPDPRSISESAPADTARIYVLNGPNLVPVGDGTDYAEFDLSPSDGESLTEATVGPVPSGAGYQVVLVFGDEMDYGTGDVPTLGGAGFEPTQYAVSDLFSVNAGQATVTDVTLVTTPFVTLDGADTAGEELLDIIFDGSAIFTATQTDVLSTVSGLGSLGSINLSAHPGFSLRSGETAIHSIDLGANSAGPLAFVNTNIGFQALNTAGVIAGFDAGLPNGPIAVLGSGGLDLGAVAYGFVQYDAGFGGYRDNDGDALPDDWMQDVDLSDFVTGEAVFDLAVANHGGTFYGYFATKLGAFRIPENVLDGTQRDSDVIFNEFSEFFRVEIGGNPAIVTQIGVDGGTYFYLGTRRGAIRVPVSVLPGTPNDTSETGAVNADLIDNQPVIAGTENQEVLDIVVDGALVVILTDHFVTVSQDSGATWKSVPTYAGGSGGANGILVDTTGSGVVLVAGPEGLSGFDVSNL